MYKCSAGSASPIAGASVSRTKVDDLIQNSSAIIIYPTCDVIYEHTETFAFSLMSGSAAFAIDAYFT